MNFDPDTIQNWQEFIREWNEEFADEFKQNVDEQNKFIQTWLNSTIAQSDDGRYEDATEGIQRAYETWIDATEEMMNGFVDLAEGKDVSVSELRDIWLKAANDSFKELMRTTAFASAQGETIDTLLDLKRQRDETTEVALHEFGLPTKGDIHEVGERLIELERRQQAVERQLEHVYKEIDT